jgi:hypothetical protein
VGSTDSVQDVGLPIKGRRVSGCPHHLADDMGASCMVEKQNDDMA